MYSLVFSSVVLPIWPQCSKINSVLSQLQSIVQSQNQPAAALQLPQLEVALSQAQALALMMQRMQTGPFIDLVAEIKHWRPQGGWQREASFSDGTLRLIGLLWFLSRGDSPLLLEEPELSLHGQQSGQHDDRVGANEPLCPRSRQLRGDHNHRGNRIGVERFESPRVCPHDGLNLRRRLIADP